MFIFVLVVWAIADLLTFIQYMDDYGKLKVAEQIAAGLIIVVGGPFFVITTILQTLLDIFFDGGQNNGVHM